MESFRRARKNQGTSPDNAKALLSARRTLRSRIDAWQDTHEDAMPELNAVVETEEVEDADEEPGLQEEDEDDPDTAGVPFNGPEDQMLFLPSDLDRSSFHAAACTSLGAFELRLRIAHAYDFIASLKMSLALKAATIQSKVRNARGTRNNIVAQKEVSQANQAVVHLAKQYNDNHRRMKALATLLKGSQYETTIPVSLKTIDLAKDLAPANLHTARTLGDSKKTDSWIFSVAPPGADRGQGQEEWEEESESPRHVPLCQSKTWSSQCPGSDGLEPGRTSSAPTRKSTCYTLRPERHTRGS